MSLTKRKELADILAESKSLDAKIVAGYNKLKESAIAAISSEFRSFFTGHGFTVNAAAPNVYSSSNKPGIQASYQGMNAVLSFHQDDDSFFTVLSNIKGSDIEYSFRVGIDNPKSASHKSRSYGVPQDEAKALEAELERAKEGLERSKVTLSGLTEAVTKVVLTSVKKKGQTEGENPSKIEPKFTTLLEYLFD